MVEQGAQVKPQDEAEERYGSVPLTDSGNAERFARRFVHKYLYTQATAWMKYSNGRWLRDKVSEAEDDMLATIRLIPEEAEGMDDKIAGAYIGFATSHESAKGRNAAMAMAALHPAFTRDYSREFNRHPELFCCGNGVFNLETGEFGSHKPGYLLTKGSNVVYDPTATCPRFEKFVSEVCCGNENLVGYLRRIAGYTLTADTGECAMFILTGGAGGGKSTYVNIVSGIMGDYAQTADAGMLMSKKGDTGQPFEFAGSEGCRALIAVEAESDKKFALARVKRMTGNDMIRACFKHKDWYEYRPAFKLYLACNEFPKTGGAGDQSVWDRLKPIPFNARFRGEKTEVKNLSDILLAEEASGILNWMLRGHAEWKATGLAEPPEARQVAAELREGEDFLGRFLEQKTTGDDRPDRMVLCSRMYEMFKFWADQEKEGRGWSSKRFVKEMEARGYKAGNLTVRGQSRRVWFDVAEGTAYPTDPTENYVPDAEDVA